MISLSLSLSLSHTHTQCTQNYTYTAAAAATTTTTTTKVVLNWTISRILFQVRSDPSSLTKRRRFMHGLQIRYIGCIGH